MYDDHMTGGKEKERKGKENAASERTANLEPIRLGWLDTLLPFFQRLKGPRFCS